MWANYWSELRYEKKKKISYGTWYNQTFKLLCWAHSVDHMDKL